MRSLFFLNLILVSVMTYAGQGEVPSASLGSGILGGTILMIKANHQMVIEGDVQAQLVKELGAEKMQKLFREMMLNHNPADLKTTYVKSEKNLTATTGILKNYEEIMIQVSRVSAEPST